MKNIAFIITTFERDELLFKSIQSLLDNWQDNFRLIVVDQGHNIKQIEKNLYIHYYQVPFNSGLSYARNYGVQIAKELGCEYCVIGSDSFLFNDSIKKINDVIELLDATIFSFCGFELENCVCGWEAKLNLIEGKHFELDFIDKSQQEDFINAKTGLRFYKVDICRNFFIAKTDSLLNVKWDDNLKLAEHEDYFYRQKKAGHKGLWTNYISAEKMTDRPNEYSKYRQENFRNGQRYLREKYNISGWVSYRHLERAKNGKI